MRGKKEAKEEAAAQESEKEQLTGKVISNKTELKELLQLVRDKVDKGSAPPVLALSVINHVMTLPNIYDLLDTDNKELAREIWLRIKRAGLQVRTPPMLFGVEVNGGERK